MRNLSSLTAILACLMLAPVTVSLAAEKKASPVSENKAQPRTLHRLVIQALDVFEHMAEGHFQRANLLCGETIKHESVVGIGTVGADNFLRDRRCHKWGDSSQFTLLITGSRDEL